jgi:hypothetical protein
VEEVQRPDDGAPEPQGQGLHRPKSRLDGLRREAASPMSGSLNSKRAMTRQSSNIFLSAMPSRTGPGK